MSLKFLKNGVNCLTRIYYTAEQLQCQLFSANICGALGWYRSSVYTLPMCCTAFVLQEHKYRMYKFVELDKIDQIKIEILKQLPSNYLNTATLFYIDNHKEIFSSINVLKDSLVKLGIFDYVVGYGFYITRPFFTGSIHLDNGNYDYSLNIPLMNCEKSQVCFYECSSEPIITDVVNDSNIKIKFNKFNQQYCTKIDSFYFTKPCIIPVKVPHNIININNTVRVSFLIRLGNGYMLN